MRYYLIDDEVCQTRPSIWGFKQRVPPTGGDELLMRLCRKIWELVGVRFREKSVKECVIHPYRKPTQVGWSSRPRRFE